MLPYHEIRLAAKWVQDVDANELGVVRKLFRKQDRAHWVLYVSAPGMFSANHEMILMSRLLSELSRKVQNDQPIAFIKKAVKLYVRETQKASHKEKKARSHHRSDGLPADSVEEDIRATESSEHDSCTTCGDS